jgi:parvulin-like peptidyl-prolyl isomerase
MTVRINGEAVTEQAIEYELGRLIRFFSQYMSAEEIRAQMAILREKARDQAVGAKLLIDEAARLDIRVPPADVDARIAEMKKGAGGEDRFKAMLARQGVSEDVLRKTIEQGRRVDLLVERLTVGIAEPAEEDIRRHFEEHKSEYRRAERAQVQHILIKNPGKEADRETAKSRLLEIRQRIADGASFAEQAAAFSDCPSGRKTGGSLGWVSRGMLVPELDRLVFAMQDGDMSEVVESSLGLHIVRKTASDPGGEATYSEAVDKVRDFLRHARRGEVISAHVAELRKKAVIEED